MQHPAVDHCVDRVEEIQHVIQRLSSLKHHKVVKECIVNFFGIPGIGKTTLLNALTHVLEQDTSVVTATLDLGLLAVEPKFVLQQQRLLQTLWEQSPNCVVEAAQLKIPDDERSYTAAVEDWSDDLTAGDRPLVLLLDSAERLNDLFLRWMERTMLLPLVRRQRVVVVIASRIALRWRQFEVRRRVYPYHIGPLNSVRTQQQVGVENSLGETVFWLTAGHPLANKRVRGHLEQHNLSHAWLLENTAFVAQDIAGLLQQETLQALSPDLHRAFTILALFREFDVNTLRAVLTPFITEFAGYSQSALLRCLKQILDTGLVRWDEQYRAYQIDTTIRQILSRAFRINDPEQCAMIREVALAYYDQLIETVPGSRNIYVREFYYHLLQQTLNPCEEAYVRTLFKQHIHTYYFSPDDHYHDTVGLADLTALLQSDDELHEALASCQLSPSLLQDMLSEVARMPTAGE